MPGAGLCRAQQMELAIFHEQILNVTERSLSFVKIKEVYQAIIYYQYLFLFEVC